MKLNKIKTNMTEVILNDNVTVFFSYNTPVACNFDGKYYRTNEHYSVTTSKHINKWLDGIEAIKKDQSFFDNLIK